MKEDKRGGYLKEQKAKLVDDRVKIIKDALKSMKKHRSERVTVFSERLAVHIKENFNENIVATTLRSNSDYRRLIDNFLGTGKIIKDSSTRQELMTKSLEVRSLKKEISMLQLQLSDALSECSKLEDKNIRNRTQKEPLREDDGSFIVIMKLLHHLDISTLNITEYSIEDKGFVIPKTLVERKDCPDFFDWFIKNSK